MVIVWYYTKRCTSCSQLELVLTKKSYQWPKYAQQNFLKQHVTYSQTAASAPEDKLFRTTDTDALLFSLLSLLSATTVSNAVIITECSYTYQQHVSQHTICTYQYQHCKV